MRGYKLKHQPTGLYFTPSRGSGNLSTKGKIYVNVKPKIEWAELIRIVIKTWHKKPSKKHKIICEFFNIDYKDGWVDTHVKTQPSDWIIEEY